MIMLMMVTALVALEDNVDGKDNIRDTEGDDSVEDDHSVDGDD